MRAVAREMVHTYGELYLSLESDRNNNVIFLASTIHCINKKAKIQTCSGEKGKFAREIY